MTIGHEFVGRIVADRLQRGRLSSPATWSAGKATWSAAAAATASPGGATCAPTHGRRRQPAGRVRRIHRAAHDQHLAPPRIGIDLDVAAIFDPFGNAVHTALSFPVLGEDVLVTGAGPIGIMAAAVARHAGARFTVITDLNPYRLELARKLGVTLAVNVRETTRQDVQKQLGMTEGFDVGLEMSGSPAAFRDMIANMSHGARIAMLGIPAEEMSIDWRTVIFNMLTIKGIYGREMYETWYKMSVMLQSGLDISPVITHR
jgi:threonine 3-dehydrogenase